MWFGSKARTAARIVLASAALVAAGTVTAQDAKDGQAPAAAAPVADASAAAALSAEARAAIVALVKQLGDTDRAVRLQAKDQLKARLPEANPVLREYVNDPDPEIRLSVRELTLPAMDELLRQAQEYWRQGLKLKRNNEAEAAQKAFQEAAVLFSKAAQAYPTHALAQKAVLLAGQSLIRAQAWDAAIRTLLPLTTKDTIPAELKPEAIYWLGDCYRKKDDLPNAFRIFKQLAQGYPESGWANYARGRLAENVFQKLDQQ